MNAPKSRFDIIINIVILSVLALIVLFAIFRGVMFYINYDPYADDTPEVREAKMILVEQSRKKNDPTLISIHEQILLSGSETSDWKLVNSAIYLSHAKAWSSLANVVVHSPNRKSVFLGAWHLTEIPTMKPLDFEKLKNKIRECSQDKSEIEFSHITPVDPGKSHTFSGSGERTVRDTFSRPFIRLMEKMENMGVYLEDGPTTDNASGQQ